MIKFGAVVITALIGTILFEIISPAINPQWLKLIIELGVVIVFGFIGLAIFKATQKRGSKVTTE